MLSYTFKWKPETKVLSFRMVGGKGKSQETVWNTCSQGWTMIPIDGIVVEGQCEVDEKALTGESFPVVKQVDSVVYAGTLNLNVCFRPHSIELQQDNVEEFQDFPGEGIYGKIDGKDIYIGNKKIVIRAGCLEVPANWSESNEGKSTGYIFIGSAQAGIFSLSDSCRIGVREALEQLKSMGIKTAMLTGDSVRSQSRTKSVELFDCL